MTKHIDLSYIGRSLGKFVATKIEMAFPESFRYILLEYRNSDYELKLSSGQI